MSPPLVRLTIDDCVSKLGRVQSLMALLGEAEPTADQAQDAFTLLAERVEEVVGILADIVVVTGPAA